MRPKSNRKLKALFWAFNVFFALNAHGETSARELIPLPDHPLKTQNPLPVQETVSGTVRDAQGNTLPGVTVRVKNENRATSTDENGKFTIRVSSNNSTLSFT